MRVYQRESSSRTGFVRQAFRVWFAIGTLAALSACGGGGGGGGSPPPANPPPANQAPVVEAGAAQTITLPANSVSLSGSATDSAGSTLTYAWTAAPSAGVAFANAAAAATTATFTDPGTYVLTLSVSDGSLSGSDTVQITVSPAAGGQGPAVQAGDDQSIELPNNEVTLTGTATGSGGAITYSWTAEPAVGVTFADATAAATTATFSEAGTYTLTLSATEASAAGSDALQVVVAPAVYPAADTDADANHGWTVVAPADVGLNAASLDAARDFALTGGGNGAIVRNGRLAYSWGDIDVLADVKSTTKSIGGMALGLALDDQLVTLNATARTYLPTLGNPPVENELTGQLGNITVLQLATHTAGFEKPGGYGVLRETPGTMFLYSDGGLNWLADMLTQVYSQDLAALLNTRVWSVLGISAGTNAGDDLRWRPNALRPQTNGAGIATRELASGMRVNANTMARVGLLHLREGVWAGQRILSKAFVDTVRTPRPENAGLAIDDPTGFPNATANYGVLWWTNAAGTLPNVPTDAYWAWGLGDSLIVVIPSLDLVIARNGNDPDDPALPRWRADWNGDYTILANFLNPIVAAVQE